MYTTKTSAGSGGIMARRQVSPHTNRYLVPGLSFEGGIFKEQQMAFSYVPRLAQSTADVQCNATNYKLARCRLKIPRQGAPEAVTVGA